MVVIAKTAKAMTVRVEMDRKMLLRRMAIRDAKVLKKQGAYGRTAMSRSMRYATKSKPRSRPGEPPRAHRDNPKGPKLRKLIKFEVDHQNRSVVIGPVKFGSGMSTVPELLDRGGMTQVKTRLVKTEYEIGDYGPIRIATSKVRGARVVVPGGRLFIRTLLETSAMCQRASRLAMEENTRRSASVFIAARPFTSPILTDGGANLKKIIKSVPL